MRTSQLRKLFGRIALLKEAGFAIDKAKHRLYKIIGTFAVSDQYFFKISIES